MGAFLFKMFSYLGAPFLNLFQSVIDGIFKAKQAKVDFASETLIGYFLHLKQQGLLDQHAISAGTQILLAEMSSDHWIVSAWRPLIALSYAVTWLIMLILAYGGTMPPSMNDTMLAVFGATNTFVMGYGLLRTSEKNSRSDLIKQIVNNVATDGKSAIMPKYGPGSKNAIIKED